MKTRTNFKKQLTALFLVCITAGLLVSVWSCSSKKVEMTVERAYALRLDGNADSALVILEQILATDSTNAVAWYELARTKHHIGLGNPRLLISHLPDLEHSIEKAVEYDPDNVIYAYYQGYIRFFKSYAAIMMGQPGALEDIKETIATYESVLDLKPDYLEAMLFLVEALSIPGEMGGDSTRGEIMADKLEEMDAVKGAKAKELFLAEDVDRIEYWQKVLEENQDNA
ncbi:hypothetical protein KKA08_07020, partial [bacterium]|nr:hypothetical protein [bacterium]